MPVKVSSISMMSSRTSQVCMNMLSWPMMWKAMPAQSRCECSRSSSAVITRIYSPLFGTSTPFMPSTAMA